MRIPPTALLPLLAYGEMMAAGREFAPQDFIPHNITPTRDESHPIDARTASPKQRGTASEIRLGSHTCDGGCGKTVSANKRRCLDCLVKVSMAGCAARGIEVSEEECRRALLKQI